MTCFADQRRKRGPAKHKITSSARSNALFLPFLIVLNLILSCTAQTNYAPSPTPEYIVTVPTFQLETRQTPTSNQQLPLQQLTVNGIEMELSGVDPLSSASQLVWAQTTIDFIATEVGNAIFERTNGYYNLSLGMQNIREQGLTSEGRLLTEFTIIMNIRSSLTFTEDDANNFVLQAFDTDQERAAYIAALKNTSDFAFVNAEDVSVSIQDFVAPTEATPTTKPPTVAPTKSPTSSPVEPPTVETPSPTESPSEITPPTEAPVDSTTSEPTASPTEDTSPTSSSSPVDDTPAPTDTTTAPIQHLKAKEMAMTLGGIKPLNSVAQSEWQQETELFIKRQIQDAVQVTLDIISQDPPFQGFSQTRRRIQDDKQQTIVFDAVISVQSQEKRDANSDILSAFDTLQEQTEYIDMLKGTGDEAFSDLSSVSVSESIDSHEPASTSKESLGATIGISVGVVVVGAAAVAVLTFFIVSRKRKRTSKRAESPLSTAADTHAENIYADEIEVGSRAEVSTLGDPIPPGMRYGDVLEGGTMFTAATDTLSADYDFQKAFHRSQLSIMDSTVGDSEIDGSSFIPKDSISLDEEYLRKNQFEVEAPSGLLGLVIDTSDEGLPTIRAIKETSCLRDQVQVGDILMAVDDEDVTPMMASTVSRLIASKQHQPIRRFVFTRLEEIDA